MENYNDRGLRLTPAMLRELADFLSDDFLEAQVTLLRQVDDYLTDLSRENPQDTPDGWFVAWHWELRRLWRLIERLRAALGDGGE